MDKSYWNSLEKKVTKWVEESDPSIMVLYLPKATKTDPFPQIKTCGSTRLFDFIQTEDVRKKFVETAYNSLGIELKKPVSVKEAMPSLSYDVLESSMDWKRPKLSELVKLYMSKTKDMKSGYWGKNEFKPEFWPSDLDFKPSTTNKAAACGVLTRPEMDRVLEAYIRWRADVNISTATCSPTDFADDNNINMINDIEDLDFETKQDIRGMSPKPSEIEDRNPDNPFAFLNKLEQESKAPKDSAGDIANTKAEMTSSSVNQINLPEDPLTVVRGEMDSENTDYTRIARIMGNASWEKFVDCCEFLEPIISRPKFEDITYTDLIVEDRFNEHVPAGWFAGKSLEQGDCLFSSISMLLTGTSDAIHHHLRVGAAVYGKIHMQHYLDKIVSQLGIDNIGAAEMFLRSVCTDETIKKWPGLSNDYKEMVLFALQEEVQITVQPFCYSGPLQVMFLAGFLDYPVFQVSHNNLMGYNEPVFPCTCTEGKFDFNDNLKILWLSFGNSPAGHVVPLFRKRQVRRKKFIRTDFLKTVAKPASTSCSGTLRNMCRSTGTFMVQCDRCKSWMHPSCMGIQDAIYEESDKLFVCCWNDSKQYKDFPVVRLGTVYRHDAYLQDVLSIQPGYWMSDFPLFVLCKYLNEKSKNIVFVYPEAMISKSLLENYHTSIFNEDKALVFPVVSRNHWWCSLLLKFDKPELIRISSLAREDDDEEIRTVARILNLEDVELTVRNAEVPRQQTPYDCGAFVASYMTCLFEVFQATDRPTTKEVLDSLKNLSVTVHLTRRFLRDIVLKNYT